MSLVRHLKVLDARTEAADAADLVRVAFASADRKHVDQHFGSAACFVIHGVDAERSRLLDVAQFGAAPRDGDGDKLADRIAALDGCVAVYTHAVGASAIKRLRARGLQPVKVAPGTPIAELLGDLRNELRNGPRSWLARALDGPKRPDRFDAMAAEEWDE